MDDVSFTINPQQFLEAIMKMSNSLDALVANTHKVAEASGKKVGGFFDTLSVKSLAVYEALKTAGQKIISSIGKNIPEIGQAFSIAGDIFTRNFLYPLRLELLPLLQKFLNWVRDHRAMFASWGAFLVSIFRIIKSAVSGLIDIVKGLWEKLASGIERIFGKTKNSVEDVINLIIFKIAFFVQVGIVLLEKFAGFMTDMFLSLLEKAKMFFEGFSTGFGKLGPIIDEGIALFTRLKDIFSRLTTASDTFNAGIKAMGFVLGTSLKAGIYAIIQAIDSLISTLELAILLKDKLAGTLKEGEFTIKAKKIKDDYVERTLQRAKEIKETAVTGYNSVTGGVQANPTSNNTSNQTNIAIPKVEINVKSDNGEKVGTDTAKGLFNQIRTESTKRGG